MVIPRENKLVRLYIQLTTTENAAEGGAAKADRSKISPETILASAQKIMAPYKITYRKLDWWTAYQIGQRVGTNFSAHERVFLAGDAVHTHSPKAGQGMNVSMQDTFNLAWKVASVVKGVSSRAILKTYQSERRRIAQDLIDFDHRFSRLFSGSPAKDVMDAEGISMEEFKDAFVKGNMFASGIAVDYGASSIVAKAGDTTAQGDGTDVSASAKFRVQSNQSLAPGIPVGNRMPSVKVLNQSDARPWHFQELLPSNGRWRIVFFVGDISKASERQRLDAIGKAMDHEACFLRQYTSASARHDSVFEILAVHCAPCASTTIFDFHPVFRPFDEVDGWDYGKIFVDEESYHEGHGRMYETFEIDKEVGCVVVIRPDQYVSYVGAVDDVESINKFFAGFMIPAREKYIATLDASGFEANTNGTVEMANGDAREAATVAATTAL